MVTNTKKALIIGINAYPAPDTLSGCVNDANAWKAYLISKGFTVTMYTDKLANKFVILNALTNLCLGTHTGDKRVFVYSGHGTQVRDLNGDESDGYDEAIVPVNFTHQGTNLILDDDIHTAINHLAAGVTMDLFFDSCHSGTVTRDLEKTDKYVEIMPGLRAPDNAGKLNKMFVPSPTMKEICWAGCAVNQTSAEVGIAGIPRGLFSYALLYVLNNYPTLTRREVNTAVCDAIASWGYPQVPQLECSGTEADELIFT